MAFTEWCWNQGVKVAGYSTGDIDGGLVAYDSWLITPGKRRVVEMGVGLTACIIVLY